jgi:hypothetical protein
MRWTSARYDQLERAARLGLRVALSRRGTEYVVTATRLGALEGKESLRARLPMTGEEMEFALEDIEWFQVIDSE